MTSKGHNTILTLAEKYGLQEGKGDDYYQCHSTWVLTKTGAEKIRIAEGIKHSFPVACHNPNGTSVGFMATFTDKAGEEVHEVGSCRTDGTANNPAKTHSHEMAIKRLKVRGILALVAPAGQVYGTDELTDEYKQHGNNQPQQQQAPQQASSYQPQAQQYNAPQDAPQQATGNGFQVPPQGAKGWVNNGEQLPTDWSNMMGKMAEVTGLDRNSFERKFYDHITQWQSPNGLYLPSGKYSTFGEYALAFKEWEGERKYNAYGALQAIKRGRELMNELENTGQVVISESNGHGGMQGFTLYGKQNNPAFQAGASAEIVSDYGGDAVTSLTDSDVPF